MYRLILASLTVMAALSVLPASAASGEQPSTPSTWSLNDILNHGSRILTETITQGLAVIQDRIEMDATTTPSSDGEESTHLLLKLFPNGKSQPDDAMSLEGTFRRSPDPSDKHFGFDLRIMPPKPKAEPKEYI
ncbi:hypothetical protein [Nitrospira sp. Nam74]